MKHKLSLLVLLAMTPACFCLHAQTPDGPPVNVNSVLAALDKVKKQQQGDIKSTEKTLAQTLMTYASSPSDALTYYMDAIIATQFDGQNHESKEIQDWKKRHEPEMKDPNFKDALCLHLMYLSLSISHDAGVKTKDLLPSLIDYTQKVLANEAGLAGQEALMETPLSKSLFVNSLQIEQYVTDNATWELVPIRVDGIYNKVILPEYRLEKNAAGIFQYWDAKILREETAAENLKRPLEIKKFNEVTKPALEWQRTEEYVALGLKNTAITHMLAIIQENKYHPDAPAWIDEVEKMVKELPAPAVPQPQPPAASAVPTVGAAPAAASPDNAQQPVQN
jgi:hypothetical protein